MRSSHDQTARTAMRRPTAVGVAVVVLFVLQVGCGASPAAKFPLYLSDAAATTEGKLDRAHVPLPDPFESALLVRWDASSPGSGPPPSAALLESFVARLRSKIESEFPIKITAVLDPDLIKPGTGSSRIIEIARERSAPYLLVAILSSLETESPVFLPLIPDTVRVMGTRTENHALAEFAVLQGKTARVLFYAEGHSYMRLDRLEGGQQSTRYPVIQRYEGETGIYPEPSQAEDTLRLVTAGEALEQALQRLQGWWNLKGK